VEDGRKMRRVRKEGKDRGTKGREGSIVGEGWGEGTGGEEEGEGRWRGEGGGKGSEGLVVVWGRRQDTICSRKIP
jgi:hypothetical protein